MGRPDKRRPSRGGVLRLALDARAGTANGGKLVLPDGVPLATVLDLALDPTKELASLAVRALANDLVIGLMSATLERP